MLWMLQPVLKYRISKAQRRLDRLIKFKKIANLCYLDIAANASA
jgi:hypothetical protein